MRKHLLLLRFLITQLLPTFLSAQSASVNLGLKEVMRRYKAIGLSVVVVKNNQIEITKIMDTKIWKQILRSYKMTSLE